MDNFYNPTPIDREIKVNPSVSLLMKINKDGIIEYINHSFSETSGYEEYEIIGESMDILRHPDVPRVIYDLLKERFSKKEPIRILNKILAKDGRYFWLICDFETKTNSNGDTLAHYAHCYAAPQFAIHKMDSLYKILLNIELKSASSEVSKKYLLGFLEERNLDYDQFVAELNHLKPEYDDATAAEFTAMRTAKPSVKKPEKIENTTSSAKKPVKQKSLLKKLFGK